MKCKTNRKNTESDMVNGETHVGFFSCWGRKGTRDWRGPCKGGAELYVVSKHRNPGSEARRGYGLAKV